MPVLPETRPSASSGTGVTGQPHDEVFGSDMAVGGDTNGDGVADFEILLANVGSLQAADFVL